MFMCGKTTSQMHNQLMNNKGLSYWADYFDFCWMHKSLNGCVIYWFINKQK